LGDQLELEPGGFSVAIGLKVRRENEAHIAPAESDRQADNRLVARNSNDLFEGRELSGL
jgi:hypothetical protein